MKIVLVLSAFLVVGAFLASVPACGCSVTTSTSASTVYDWIRALRAAVLGQPKIEYK